MPDTLKEKFVYSDPATYQWVISGTREGKSIPLFLLSIIAVAHVVPACAYFFTVYGYFLLLVVSQFVFRSNPEKVIPAVLGWGSIVIMSIIILAAIYFALLAWRGKRKGAFQAQSHLHELLVSSLGVLTFIITGPFKDGFQGGTESFWQFYLFYIDNVLRVTLLDIPEVFDLRLSSIRPTSWYAQLATATLRVLIAAGLVSFLWEVYEKSFHKSVFYGSVQQFFWKCENMLDIHTLQVRREGKVDVMPAPEPFVKMKDFVDELADEDFRARRTRKKN